MWQEAVDDCTRVIEYNLAFNDGFEKMPDACYKAMIRRAQGYRMMKEWDYCWEDLDECEKLLPEEVHHGKLRAQYKEDHEHEDRVINIMANSKALEGKEYIDFLLDFLQGRKGA
jgi:hypothetical protein